MIPKLSFSLGKDSESVDEGLSAIAESEWDAEPRNDAEEEDDNVIDIAKRREKMVRESTADQSHMVSTMSDIPSRHEVASELRAAEARTETRIAQLSATIEARAAASDHKIDLLIGRMDNLSTVLTDKIVTLAGAVAEVKADSKETRKTVWVVGVGSILAMLGLVIAIWIAGINQQNNLVAIFQAGLGIRTLPVENESPKGPPAAMSPSPRPPASPAGK